MMSGNNSQILVSLADNDTSAMLSGRWRD